MNFKLIFDRFILLITNPKAAWDKISQETDSVQEVYTKYLIPAGIIAAISSFIKSSIIGVTIPFLNSTFRVPFIHGLFSAIIFAAIGLAAVYLVAHIVKFLSPKFGGKEDFLKGFYLIAYTAFASFCIAPIQLLPFGILISLLFLFVVVYLLYTGITPTTGVPETSRLPFLASLIVAYVIVALIVSSISTMLLPRPDMSGALNDLIPKDFKLPVK